MRAYERTGPTTRGRLSLEAAVAASAPPEDLHGDIDGYVLAHEPDAAQSDIADLLTRAYLTGDLEQTRLTHFLALLGPTPINTLEREIACYARTFAAASSLLST